METPQSIAAHITARTKREPGTRTLADLQNDPRFIAARARAQARISDITPAPAYTPPQKPVRRFSDDELTEALEHCAYCGGMGVVAYQVPVTDSRHGQTAPCPNCYKYKAERRVRRDVARMQDAMDHYSMLKGQLITKTFRNFEKHCPAVEKALATIYRWTTEIYNQDPEAKPFLYVHGPTGTGKTHLAAASANGLSTAHIPVVFTTFPQLLGMVSANHFDQTEAAISALQSIPVLILDDIRSENLKSPWASSVLFRIIDHRYVTQSPTMVVSNHPLRNTDPTKTVTTLAQFEPRVASRLADNQISKIVTVIAKDHRTA